MSMRVYQLSKKLGISNKDLVDILKSKGFDVSSASSSIADIYAEELIVEYETKLHGSGSHGNHKSAQKDSCPEK